MTKVLRAGQFKADEGDSPRWEEDALGFLIAPVGKEDFLANYYEQKPLINIRNEPDRYADLLTLGIVDHFINSADLREGLVDLTNHRNRIERCFNRLKHFRRFSTRYDRRTIHFQGFVHLAAIMIWLR